MTISQGKELRQSNDEVAVGETWADGLSRWVPICILLGVGLFNWAVFYPGLLSLDSVAQYRQAVQGHYTDQNPAIMAICLSAVFRVGGDIQHLMLVQCLCGLAGVYALAVAAAEIVFGKVLSRRFYRYAGLFVVLLLLNPLSPLAFHLMTFWKDVWLMIALCWLGFIWLRASHAAPGMSKLAYSISLCLFLGISTLAVIVRHNSVAILPLLSVMFAILVRQVGTRKQALIASLGPVLMYAGTSFVMTRVFNVTHVGFERIVYAYELVSLCYFYPDLEDSLPYTHAHLADNYRSVYYAGHHNLFGDCEKRSFFADPESIRREYIQAALRFPLQLTMVKLRKVRHHFISNGSLLFHADVDPNEFGIVQTDRMSGLRQWLRLTLWDAFHNAHRKWLFTRHAVWLGADVLALAASGVLWWLTRERRYFTLLLMTLMPLGYYFSFVLASTSSDFRYMYVSDVMVQVMTFAFLFGCVGIGIGKLAARWTNGANNGASIEMTGGPACQV
jgi:hypothetical protein